MHMLSPTDSIEKDSKTPTYQLAKYFEKLLSHLVQSDYIVNSTKHFTE